MKNLNYKIDVFKDNKEEIFNILKLGNKEFCEKLLPYFYKDFCLESMGGILSIDTHYKNSSLPSINIEELKNLYTPEIWEIKITPENKEYLNNFLIQKNIFTNNLNYQYKYLRYDNITDSVSWSYGINNEYPIITDEFFLTLIYNKNKNEQETITKNISETEDVSTDTGGTNRRVHNSETDGRCRYRSEEMYRRLGENSSIEERRSQEYIQTICRRRRKPRKYDF